MSSQDRWTSGFLRGPAEFTDFWTSLARDGRDRKGVLICGRGFDPRTLEAPRALVAAGFPIDACRLIHLTDGHNRRGLPRNPEAAINEAALREILSGVDLTDVEAKIRDDSGRLVGADQVKLHFGDNAGLGSFTDVIVDITALPTSFSFPLLGQLIWMHDSAYESGANPFNVHCVVCENPTLDKEIRWEGGDSADYIDPFRGLAGRSAETDPITLWAPVLGENQAGALRKIYEMLAPGDVKPVLPFPAANPRRGDDLVREYRTLLFDTWGVDPVGFIYADERDPFDVYSQLTQLVRESRDALRPLGNVHPVMSAHTSKLLSLGVLLAAFDQKAAVAHVEPTDYVLDPSREGDFPTSELYEVWLAGEAYAEDA